MSFKIPEGLQRGDTVEVLLRGEVTDTGIGVGNGNGWFDLGDAFTFEPDDADVVKLVVSVEKVKPPLPTTPGSVVRSRGSLVTFLLGPDGLWYSPNGARNGQGLRALPDVDIIYVSDDAL